MSIQITSCSMDIKLFFIVFIGSNIPLIASSLDYVDCGSNFYITSVELEKCDEVPCSIIPGEKRTITVNSKNLAVDVEKMESEAVVAQMGHVWHMLVTPNNPCDDWGCPLLETKERTYKGDITFSESLIRRPSTLMLRTVFEGIHGTHLAFCIELSVDFR